MAESQNLDTLKTYVGDMYSLESHIEEALDSQLEKCRDHPKANAAVRRFHNTVAQATGPAISRPRCQTARMRRVLRMSASGSASSSTRSASRPRSTVPSESSARR